LLTIGLRPEGQRLRPAGQGAVSFYVLACKIFANFPFELKKAAGNSIEAANSISRNISEGYCRRRLKEYLNCLNMALGSCGEFHTCYTCCAVAPIRSSIQPVDPTGCF
jgi:four helix bundle protein